MHMYEMLWIFLYWIVFNSMQSIVIQKQPKMIHYNNNMLQFGYLKLVLFAAPALISTTQADMIHMQQELCTLPISQ